MSEQQSFEMAYERKGAAEQIMQALGHQVCEGLRTANWAVPELGARCVLNYYEQRQVVQDGETITMPTPFYLLYATYKEKGLDTVLNIDFGTHFSTPIRKVREHTDEKGKKTQKDIAWNEAMGACDELMRAGVIQALGRMQPPSEIAQTPLHIAPSI